MKKAFTLAEVAIVFVIIGVISVIAVSTIKPWEKAAKYAYMRAYNAIGLSVYNHLTTATDIVEFPDTAQKLCEAMVSYMNTTESKCDDTSRILGLDPTDANFTPEDDNYKEPMIITTGGMKMWIGASSDTTPVYGPFKYTKEFTVGGKDVVSYFMVYVDLNGDKGPDSAIWDKEDIADIVAFVVTDKLIVVPVGYPEIDTRYLVAHVVYPSLSETLADAGDVDLGEEADDEVISEAMSLYEAKARAYGKRPVAENNYASLPVYGEVLTYDFDKDFGDSNPFKIGNNDDYQTMFPTLPDIDEKCDSSDGAAASSCSIKIYDYH